MKPHYIKPLEWKDNGTAQLGELFYWVYFLEDIGWCMFVNDGGRCETLTGFKTEEEAKAACEEHLRKYLSQYLIEGK